MKLCKFYLKPLPILYKNNLFILLLIYFSNKLSHIKSNFVKYKQIKKITIDSKIDEHLNIDGEIKGATPITISILPKKIKIYHL